MNLSGVSSDENVNAVGMCSLVGGRVAVHEPETTRLRQCLIFLLRKVSGIETVFS